VDEAIGGGEREVGEEDAGGIRGGFSFRSGRSSGVVEP
jgi:hypothetical protein